jgi:hypothetical protein
MVISPIHGRKLSLTNWLLQMLVVFQLVKNVLHFMVLGDLLPYSQVPAIWPVLSSSHSCMVVKLKSWWNIFNPLEPELSAQCTLQKTEDFNGCPLLCMFWSKNFRWQFVFSASGGMSTEVIFQYQIYNIRSFSTKGNHLGCPASCGLFF